MTVTGHLGVSVCLIFSDFCPKLLKCCMLFYATTDVACTEISLQPEVAFTHADYLTWQVKSAPVLHAWKAWLIHILWLYAAWSVSVQPACSLVLFSVCSTTIEMESIGSSGRSTPALLNGQSSARSSATKTMTYTCRWDLCPQCYNSSPDLAEHIRGIHVDGQRGGVGRF